VLHSNVINLPTNLAFIKMFTFERNIGTGEVGYALSSLEAVVEYTRGHFYELAAQSIKSIRTLLRFGV
jgi:Vacuolar sorting protein 9 (VPS9) domain